MTREEARAYANQQAADARAGLNAEAQALRDLGVRSPEDAQRLAILDAVLADPHANQMGHTVSARDAPESGITGPEWDQQQFQVLNRDGTRTST